MKAREHISGLQRKNSFSRKLLVVGNSNQGKSVETEINREALLYYMGNGQSQLR